MNPFVILRTVAEESGLPGEMLLGPRRTSNLVVARWVAALLIKQHCGFGKTTIGHYLNRDRTTVAHGLRTIRGRMEKDRDLMALYLRTAARLSPDDFAEAAE